MLNHSPKQLIITKQRLLDIEQIAYEEFFSGEFLKFSNDKYMIILTNNNPKVSSHYRTVSELLIIEYFHTVENRSWYM